MRHRMGLTGESSDHKLAGIVSDEATAHVLAKAVRAGAGLTESHVSVLSPGDDQISSALEPENRGIVHTMIRAHLWLGLAGSAVGALGFAIMMALDIEFVVLSPRWSAALLIGFGTIGGLLLGGVVSLRPDHAPYIAASREALQKGHYVIVVHASSPDQLKAAQAILTADANKTIRTL